MAHRVLPQPSKVLAVSLPRPMGIILEEDARRGRIVVSGFTEGSPAEKAAKVLRSSTLAPFIKYDVGST